MSDFHLRRRLSVSDVFTLDLLRDWIADERQSFRSLGGDVIGHVGEENRRQHVEAINRRIAECAAALLIGEDVVRAHIGETGKDGA